MSPAIAAMLLPGLTLASAAKASSQLAGWS
jgi:hypothetical protein